jgi:hypothetical protein
VKIPKWPDPVPVTGKVTYGDQPLAGAIVSFNPEGSTVGQGASAKTDDTGKFELQTRMPDNTMKKGCIPGKYKVLISRLVNPDGSVWVPKDGSQGPAMTGAKEELPRQYSDPGMTQLRADVTASGGTFDFSIPKK